MSVARSVSREIHRKELPRAPPPSSAMALAGSFEGCAEVEEILDTEWQHRG